MAKVDEDLAGTWEFLPVSRNVGGVVIYDAVEEYGEAPFRFRTVKQNGSRVHLRLLTPEGEDARYPADDEFLAGERIERRVYSSDMRRGINWRRLS